MLIPSYPQQPAVFLGRAASGERRRQEGGNVFDDKIRVGVAVYFLVRRKGVERFRVYYNAVDDYAKAFDKVSYIGGKAIDAFDFAEIVPDAESNWFNQSDSGFVELIALADRQTKFAKTVAGEQAVFDLFTSGAKTNRDEWVFDFDLSNLRSKAMFFLDTYNDSLDAGDKRYEPAIKWSSTLQERHQRGVREFYNDAHRVRSLHRPFTFKQYYASVLMNDRLTRNHFEMFGNDLRQPNQVICFRGLGSNKPFDVLATDTLMEHQLLMNMQCLSLYRYTADGERVSNITEWGLRQFREHYGDDAINSEDIFAYTYAMLHDPAYRQRYEVDLRRGFPRVYFQEDFAWWAEQGRELLVLHLGFETLEPWPLERVEKDGVTPTRAILRADEERNVITLDEQTSLSGVPSEA